MFEVVSATHTVHYIESNPEIKWQEISFPLDFRVFYRRFPSMANASSEFQSISKMKPLSTVVLRFILRHAQAADTVSTDKL